MASFLLHSIKRYFMSNNTNEQNETKIEQHVSEPEQLIKKGSNVEKDPDEWITGSEEMTGAQKSYLKTLSDEAGEPFDETLSKAAASKRIEELQQKTGRGLNKQDN